MSERSYSSFSLHSSTLQLLGFQNLEYPLVIYVCLIKIAAKIQILSKIEIGFFSESFYPKSLKSPFSVSIRSQGVYFLLFVYGLCWSSKKVGGPFSKLSAKCQSVKPNLVEMDPSNFCFLLFSEQRLYLEGWQIQFSKRTRTLCSRNCCRTNADTKLSGHRSVSLSLNFESLHFTAVIQEIYIFEVGLVLLGF